MGLIRAAEPGRPRRLGALASGWQGRLGEASLCHKGLANATSPILQNEFGLAVSK